LESTRAALSNRRDYIEKKIETEKNRAKAMVNLKNVNKKGGTSKNQRYEDENTENSYHSFDGSEAK